MVYEGLLCIASREANFTKWGHLGTDCWFYYARSFVEVVRIVLCWSTGPWFFTGWGSCPPRWCNCDFIVASGWARVLEGREFVIFLELASGHSLFLYQTGPQVHRLGMLWAQTIVWCYFERPETPTVFLHDAWKTHAFSRALVLIPCDFKLVHRQGQPGKLAVLRSTAWWWLQSEM